MNTQCHKLQPIHCTRIDFTCLKNSNNGKKCSEYNKSKNKRFNNIMTLNKIIMKSFENQYKKITCNFFLGKFSCSLYVILLLLCCYK